MFRSKLFNTNLWQKQIHGKTNLQKQLRESFSTWQERGQLKALLTSCWWLNIAWCWETQIKSLTAIVVDILVVVDGHDVRFMQSLWLADPFVRSVKAWKNRILVFFHSIMFMMFCVCVFYSEKQTNKPTHIRCVGALTEHCFQHSCTSGVHSFSMYISEFN